MQPPLKALWHDAKDEWDQAHNIVQQEDDAASAWVHAYLHRKEGDDGNAGYWYRRAKRPLPAERSRKNGKASCWRCSASINRSLKRPQAQKPATLAESVGDTIKLVDGRPLGWAEFGDPQGLPLFHFHGFPASRLEGKLIEAAALRNAIRVIASDRPGYGISDFQSGRRLLDWPCDVKALADRLSIDRFMVLGVSIPATVSGTIESILKSTGDSELHDSRSSRINSMAEPIGLGAA